MRMLAGALRDERGDSLIEGLLALGLVLLVVAFAVEGVLYAHARNVAEAAAQDGARSGATGGPVAGANRANAILAAAGGLGAALHATAKDDGIQTTVTVRGPAPRLFALPLGLPSISVSASLPDEHYSLEESGP
jgi:Flp pilus assembly protein TadG